MSGLAMGALWGLIAVALVLTWTATRTLNFAQGEFVALGALISASFLGSVSLPVTASWAVLVPLLAVLGGGAGALLYVGVIDRIDSSHAGRWMVATVAISMILIALAERVWGTNPQPVPSPFGESIIHVAGSGFLTHQLFIAVVGVLLILGLDFAIRRTRLGMVLRAVAQDRLAAEYSGVRSRRVGMQTYAISGALSAVSGLLVGPLVFAAPGMGLSLLLGGFAVAIIGGLTSIRGVLLAAPLYGIIDALIRNSGPRGPSIASVFGLLVVVLILAIKPSGLLGTLRSRKA